ncbi:Ketol-acid reductoisomerase (NADP(+)) [Geodia barretti]|uniref:Ketol-acid reductoisomerase (NADP(+)) n=1 Tax=Geodia barretti TaxID=519541 RepID=A0AA35X6D4_GEOBA|nr:Ketol-acid reductoisomerase (NADP(+)) [Geodia barretti]
MVNVYYDQDADLGILQGKTIGIIGYGSQGHAHALNLKDNGQNVVVGLYPGSSSIAVAEAAGLRVAEVPEVAKEADVVMMVIPDHVRAGSTESRSSPT